MGIKVSRIQDIKEITISHHIIKLTTHSQGKSINNKQIEAEEGEEVGVEVVADSMEDKASHKILDFPLLHLQIERSMGLGSFQKSRKVRKRALVQNNTKAHIAQKKNLNNQVKGNQTNLNLAKIHHNLNRNIPNLLRNYKDKLQLRVNNPRYNRAIDHKTNNRSKNSLSLMITLSRSM